MNTICFFHLHVSACNSANFSPLVSLDASASSLQTHPTFITELLSSVSFICFYIKQNYSKNEK